MSDPVSSGFISNISQMPDIIEDYNHTLQPSTNTQLPNDVLKEIFKNVHDFKDMFQASRVCKNWETIASQTMEGTENLGEKFSFLNKPKVEIVAEQISRDADNRGKLFTISDESSDSYAIIPSYSSQYELELIKVDPNDVHYFTGKSGTIGLFKGNVYDIPRQHRLTGGPVNYTAYAVHPSGICAGSLQEYSAQIDILNNDGSFKLSLLEDREEQLFERNLKGLHFQNDTLVAAFTAEKLYDAKKYTWADLKEDKIKYNPSNKYGRNGHFNDELENLILRLNFVRIYSLEGEILENIYLNSEILEFVCNDEYIAVRCYKNTLGEPKILYIINVQDPQNPIKIELPKTMYNNMKIGKDFVAVGDGRNIYTYNLKTGKPMQSFSGGLLDIIDNVLVTYSWSDQKMHFITMNDKHYLESAFELPYMKSIQMVPGEYLLGIGGSIPKFKVIRVTPEPKVPQEAQVQKEGLLKRIARSIFLFESSKR